jgi:small subunit ribosomal protein S9
MTKETPEYFEGIGRRKESVARVRVMKSEKASYIINDKEAKIFFPVKKFQNTIFAPLVAIGLEDKIAITVKVKGGGLTGQSDAIKLGLSRALVKSDNELHRALKDLDFLKRDARKKERKKPGLKKARRSAQWRKR